MKIAEAPTLPLRPLVRQLVRAGMASAAEAEPPHGSALRILYGRFEGHLVFATAGRPASGLTAGRTRLSSTRFAGVTVREVIGCEGGPPALTFTTHGVGWLLSARGSAPLTTALRGLVTGLISQRQTGR